MNWFETVLNALDGKMDRPTAYGWFHLMFIGIMIALSVGGDFSPPKSATKNASKV